MAIFDDLKTVAKVLQEAGKIEQYKQILEVQGRLLEMQEKIRLQDEEIRTLKEKLKIKENIVFEKDAYWIKRKDNSKEGPYCSACWDNEDKKQLVHLHSISGVTNAFRCPVCKNGVRMDSASANSDSSPHVIPRDDSSW